MTKQLIHLAAVLSLSVSCVYAQQGTAVDPYPAPINTTDAVVRVGITDFAMLPRVGGEAPRLMHMLTEPGTRRLFVSEMTGTIYSVSYDGRSVAPYLNVNDPRWNVAVQSQGRERGLQSFAFHPQFAQQGSRGYGKFYTYTDVESTAAAADFQPKGSQVTHHTVLLEWTARNPAAAAYDGAAPRELFRLRQPFANHNAGQIAFNPNAQPNTPDFGMLYVGVADGGSGGDPLMAAQDPSNAFGKIFRIDPLGTNGRTKQYGIPADNPFVDREGTLPEIWAVGVRNPQRFAWDPRTGNLYVADIGQNIVEEVSQVPKGGNLGWNTYEASFRFVSRTELRLNERRNDPKFVYPLVEYDHRDPLFPSGRSSITGVIVYRDDRIPQLANLLLFADIPSGEMFYVSAGQLPQGGQDPIRRVLFTSNDTGKNLLQVIREKTPDAERADIRFGQGPDGRVFLINKADGVVRELTK
jgi:glucose/arabinose dehydrogenase